MGGCDGCDGCDGGGYDCGGTSFVKPPSNHLDKKNVRDWWHNVWRNHGRFDCYAVFLILPSDKETIRYLMDFGREAEIVSGESCLVITLSKTGFGFNKSFKDDDDLGLMDRLHKIAVTEHAMNGYSDNFAQLFQVDVTEFPCLLLFRDIRSSQHFVAALKGMKAEEISEYIRAIFSIVRKASKEKEDVFVALERHKNNENLLKSGKSILTKSSGLAGKTLEVAIEAFINSVIK